MAWCRRLPLPASPKERQVVIHRLVNALSPERQAGRFSYPGRYVAFQCALTEPLHCVMTDPRDDHRAAELLDVTENASFNSARRHVGAAGFVQRDVLEQIISAGKEQIGVTRSLRQVIDVTQAQ